MKAIPPAIEHLKQFPYWVCQDANKRPINPKTGFTAKWGDEENLGTFDECEQYYQNNKNNIQGLHKCIIVKRHMGIVCIDLDKDPNPVFFDGELTRWAYDIVKSLNTYTEYSRSNTGLHILAFGEIERAVGAKTTHGLEMYNHNKIWTITGRHFAGTPLTIESRQTELTTLYNQYVPKREYKPVREYQYASDTPSTQQVADMLSCIPLPLGYNEWVEVCMSVHSAYPNEDGFDLVMNWSSGHFKEGENETLAMRSRWRSFTQGAGINVGTLFHYAKMYGWTPPIQDSFDVSIPTITKTEKTTPLPPDNFDSNDCQDVVEPSKPEIVTITPDEAEHHYNKGYKAGYDKGYWRGYHDGMTEAQRQSWLTTGIPDNALDYVIDNFSLGFRPETIDTDTGEIQTNSLSIPFFTGDDTANVEYRCLDSGLVTYELNTPVLYNTTKDAPTNHVCILDDSIDSIKAWLQFGHVEVGSSNIHFMALPKTKININCLDVLLGANYIYVIAGKDTPLKGRGLELLKSSARFIRLPMATSDTFNLIDEHDFLSLLRSGDRW